MTRTQALAVLAAFLLRPSLGWTQPVRPPAAAPPAPIVAFEQPDAQRTRDELSRLLEHYPPSLRGVFGLDPSLLSNSAYLAPYPALASFLNAHPEIARNPGFYIDAPFARVRDPGNLAADMWRDVLGGLAALTAFGMGIGLLIWLIRTLIDYRRWNRLAKVQTDVHTKLLDRFTANEDLLAYIQSPAGSKFLQSSPITLDAGSRSVGAPLGRILWSVQGGVVLMAAGIGLQVMGNRISGEASQPLNALGVLGIALGLGFLLSAIISFMISHRMGLIEPAPPAPRAESPGPQA